jgi:hypothetical protein
MGPLAYGDPVDGLLQPIGIRLDFHAWGSAIAQEDVKPPRVGYPGQINECHCVRSIHRYQPTDPVVRDRADVIILTHFQVHKAYS